MMSRRVLSVKSYEKSVNRRRSFKFSILLIRITLTFIFRFKQIATTFPAPAVGPRQPPEGYSTWEWASNSSLWHSPYAIMTTMAAVVWHWCTLWRIDDDAYNGNHQNVEYYLHLLYVLIVDDCCRWKLMAHSAKLKLWSCGRYNKFTYAHRTHTHCTNIYDNDGCGGMNTEHSLTHSHTCTPTTLSLWW